MTAPTYPTATHCARCDALDTAHEIRANGTRGQRLGQTAGASGNVACAGFKPGRVVELVPEGELRRRLDAVLALEVPDPRPGLSDDQNAFWALGYAHALVIAKRAARGGS